MPLLVYFSVSLYWNSHDNFFLVLKIFWIFVFILDWLIAIALLVNWSTFCQHFTDIITMNLSETKGRSTFMVNTRLRIKKTFWNKQIKDVNKSRAIRLNEPVNHSKMQHFLVTLGVTGEVALWLKAFRPAGLCLYLLISFRRSKNTCSSLLKWFNYLNQTWIKNLL